MLMVMSHNINRNPQQYSRSLVVKSGTINLYLEQGTKPALSRWKIKENHNIKRKLAQILHDENIWLADITKPNIFQFFMCLTSFVVAILIKFYCFISPFVPSLDAKSVISELTTRDSERCWWALLSPWCCLILVWWTCQLTHWAWISNYIHDKVWDGITNPITKLQQLHLCVISSHTPFSPHTPW